MRNYLPPEEHDESIFTDPSFAGDGEGSGTDVQHVIPIAPPRADGDGMINFDVTDTSDEATGEYTPLENEGTGRMDVVPVAKITDPIDAARYLQHILFESTLTGPAREEEIRLGLLVTDAVPEVKEAPTTRGLQSTGMEYRASLQVPSLRTKLTALLEKTGE